MDIVYASNDLYARHLAVSMISLFDRNQQAEEITVYVLSVGITEESRQKLQEIAERYHRKLEFLDLTEIAEDCGPVSPESGTSGSDGYSGPV